MATQWSWGDAASMVAAFAAVAGLITTLWINHLDRVATLENEILKERREALLEAPLSTDDFNAFRNEVARELGLRQLDYSKVKAPWIFSLSGAD